MKGKWLATVNLIVGLVFVLGAGLQYNDPDPLGWAAIYLGAGLSCALWRRTPRAWLLAALVALAALGWAAVLFLHMPAWVNPVQMFESMQSYGGAVELNREFWGLALILSWMLLLVRLR